MPRLFRPVAAALTILSLSLPGAARAQSCEDSCGGQSPGECWCDASCSTYGDCCDDYADFCESVPEPEPEPEPTPAPTPAPTSGVVQLSSASFHFARKSALMEPDIAGGGLTVLASSNETAEVQVAAAIALPEGTVPTGLTCSVRGTSGAQVDLDLSMWRTRPGSTSLPYGVSSMSVATTGPATSGYTSVVATLPAGITWAYELGGTLTVADVSGFGTGTFDGCNVGWAAL